MPKQTIQDRFILALVERGERLVKTTHKYIVYSRKEEGYYYVGKSGALRIGKNVATSIPASVGLRQNLLVSVLGK